MFDLATEEEELVCLSVCSSWEDSTLHVHTCVNLLCVGTQFNPLWERWTPPVGMKTLYEELLKVNLFNGYF